MSSATDPAPQSPASSAPAMPLARIVSANIRELRKEAAGGAGLSVRELAAALGVSKSAVSLWETYGCDVPLRRLEQIAQVFAVPVARLLLAPVGAVPAPPVSLGELRESIVAVMELGGCFGANMGESKDVLVRVDGVLRRLSGMTPSFHNGRFVFLLTAGALDPVSGSAAWYQEHPQAAAVARELGMAIPVRAADTP